MSNMSGNLNIVGTDSNIYSGICSTANSISTVGDLCSWMDISSTTNSISSAESALDAILSVLTENELIDIIQKMIERNESSVRTFVSQIIKLRHFSEDFLIMFINYINRNKIKEINNIEKLDS